MKEYFLFLTITLILSFCMGLIKKENFIMGLFSSILIAFPLAFLAGIRTINIGTDMLVYGLPNFKAAQTYSSYFDYIKDVSSSGGTEAGYATLNYIVSRFTDNVNLLMFVISLITVVTFVYASFRYKKLFTVSVTFQIFVFFCLFYGSSLNLMRQTLAISFVYLSMSFFLAERTKKDFIIGAMFLLVAILFHRSAIIIIPFVIVFCMDWQNDGTFEKLIKGILILFVGIVVMNQLIGDSSSYVLKYGRYVGVGGQSSQAQGGQSFLKALQSSAIPAFVIFILIFRTEGNYFKDKFEERVNLSKYFLIVVLSLDIFLQLVSTWNVVVGRIGLFFKVFEILGLPIILNLIISRKLRSPLILGSSAYLLLAFYIYTISGFNSIYPYQSIWIL